jgi:hypothetical protein
MKLHHFYHCYADGNCETPIREHIGALLSSGLYNELETFQIGFVGSKQKRDEAKHCISTLGVEFEVCAEADHGWEQVTQIPMWEYAHGKEGAMLYAHTKGASNGEDVNVRWRRSMTYWNVLRWKDCAYLLETYEAVGCHWIYPIIGAMPEHKIGNPMFAGTFWWAKCALIETFMRPPLTHRHEAEGWIGYKYVEKPFPIYDFTPYFPNSGPFADDWQLDHQIRGTSI